MIVVVIDLVIVVIIPVRVDSIGRRVGPKTTITTKTKTTTTIKITIRDNVPRTPATPARPY